MLPPAHLCVACQGSKNLCGVGHCPILQKMRIQNYVFTKVKPELFGQTPPNIFVGHSGYPIVSVGAMASEQHVEDDPRRMFGMTLKEIVQQRSQLFRSAVKRDVIKRDRYIQDMQEVVLSQVPIDIELKFKYPPKAEVHFSPLMQPMGPLGILEKYSIVGNAKIPTRVDSLANDSDITTMDAIKELVYRGYDNYYLTRVLSAGVFGRATRKKLVPTRWSITAMDDIISKIYMEVIRESQEISSYELYFSEYLSNRYVIMLMPGKWEFENFEAWAHGSLWNLEDPKRGNTYITVEYEPFGGRTSYADSQVGGYYASRYAVTEHLFNRRRQARVIAIREIESGYMVPVGVWQVRENVRNAFKQGATTFSSLNDMLDYVKLLLRNDLSEYLKRDKMIRQGRIVDFV